MRIAFMGTPPFSAPILEALLGTDHDIVAVYSQPPRPSGRGHKLQKSAVQQLAEQHHIPVFTPKNFKHPDDIKTFQDHQLDLTIVVAYGLIVPQEILDAPTYGCVNIHASLLPRWRGAAPIQRAIEAGDEITGIALMQMEAGLDTGPVYAEASTEIGTMNSAELHTKLSEMGAKLLLEKLDDLPHATPVKQSEKGLIYAKKIEKAESIIDWALPADVIHRKLRAFTPWPGLSFSYQGETIRLKEAGFSQDNHDFLPGTVTDDQLTIACGAGFIKPLMLQRAGKQAVPTQDFLRGIDLPQGTVLCTATN